MCYTVIYMSYLHKMYFVSIFIYDKQGGVYMSSFKLGLVQSKVYDKKEKNIENIRELISVAKERSADIVVLPEMFNCPYHASNFPVYGEVDRGETWNELSSIAKELKIYLIAGSVPVLGEDGKVYNTSYVFNPEGVEIAKHNKMHLFDIDIEGGQTFKESETLSGGNEVTVFETDYCKIGLAICYDIRFPELSRLMALEGAEVIIIPGAFNLTTGPAHWELLFRARALDNQVYAAGIAPARDMEASYHSYANSMVVNPWGEVIARLEENEDVIVCDIDLDLVRKIREELPLLKHRRTDIYSMKKI